MQPRRHRAQGRSVTGVRSRAHPRRPAADPFERPPPFLPLARLRIAASALAPFVHTPSSGLQRLPALSRRSKRQFPVASRARRMPPRAARPGGLGFRPGADASDATLAIRARPAALQMTGVGREPPRNPAETARSVASEHRFDRDDRIAGILRRHRPPGPCADRATPVPNGAPSTVSHSMEPLAATGWNRCPTPAGRPVPLALASSPSPRSPSPGGPFARRVSRWGKRNEVAPPIGRVGATRAGGVCDAGLAAALERGGEGAGGAREFPGWEARRRSRAPPRGIALAVVGVAPPCARGQARGAGVGATGAGRFRTRARASVRGASGGSWAGSGFDGVGGDRGARGDGASARRYRGAPDRRGRAGALAPGREAHLQRQPVAGVARLSTMDGWRSTPTRWRT